MGEELQEIGLEVLAGEELVGDGERTRLVQDRMPHARCWGWFINHYFLCLNRRLPNRVFHTNNDFHKHMESSG